MFCRVECRRICAHFKPGPGGATDCRAYETDVTVYKRWGRFQVRYHCKHEPAAAKPKRRPTRWQQLRMELFQEENNAGKPLDSKS